MPEFDFSPITEGIYNVIETEEKVLTSLPEETITQKRNRQNRTIKQILGHLIDSASNNHQRMIRLQYSIAEGVTFQQDFTFSKGVKSAAKQQIGGERKCG